MAGATEPGTRLAHRDKRPAYAEGTLERFAEGNSVAYPALVATWTKLHMTALFSTNRSTCWVELRDLDGVGVGDRLADNYATL